MTRLEVTPLGERELVITRAFNAPRTLVWDCHTKPELVRRWLLGPCEWTMPVCEIDLRVGGNYRFVWRKSDGTEMEAGGVYREIAAPERLVQTQVFNRDWTSGETIGTLLLAESNGITSLTNTLLYPSEAARDGALGSRMEEGMEAGYARLVELMAMIGSSGTSDASRVLS